MTSILMIAAVAMQLSGAASLPPEAPGEACAPFIEIHADAQTAALRAHRNALESCSVDEATYQRLVGAWLAAHDVGGEASRALFLGRAVAYPWLSSLIADTALTDSDVATQTSQTENAWLAALLSSAPLIDRLQAPFQDSGHRIRRVSVEKVLWGPASRHASDPSAGETRVPFDAQIWIEFDRDD